MILRDWDNGACLGIKPMFRSEGGGDDGDDWIPAFAGMKDGGGVIVGDWW